MAQNETTRPDGLSEHEWQVILDLRKRRVFDDGRNAGLKEAASLSAQADKDMRKIESLMRPSLFSLIWSVLRGRQP